MNNKAIEISNVSKSFAKHLVIDNLSLDILEGEVFGLIALNGTGKTTLIKSMLDLIKIDSGNIKFWGKEFNESNGRDKIVFLPEKFHPNPLLTGREFLNISLSYHNVEYNKNNVEQIAIELDFPIEALDRKIKSYSKGMGQKLGLMTSFLSNADLFILDEPMSGLDPKARILVKKYILKLKQMGKTIFFSSHLLYDMQELCSRVAILHEKSSIFVGLPEEFGHKFGSDNLEEAFLKAITIVF